MPFKFLIENKDYNGCWLNDFMVHPEHRRKGLGAVLSDGLTSQNDVVFICCNDKALKLLTSKGWEQDWNSYLHFFLIDPIKHPRIGKKILSILRRVIRTVSRPIIKYLLVKKRVDSDELLMKKLTDKNIAVFVGSECANSLKLTTVRNREYLTWRFVDSPDYSSYRVVKLDNSDQHFSVKLVEAGKQLISNVEILMSSNMYDLNCYKNLVGAVNMFMYNKYSYLISYINSELLSKLLKKEMKCIVKYQNYAYKRDDSVMMGYVKSK